MLINWYRFASMLIGALFGDFEERLAVMEFEATLPIHEFTIPGENFYQNILKWNETEEMRFKLDALMYYREMYGFINPSSDPALYMMLFQTNPALGMKTTFLAEETVPENGFSTLAAGWMVRVIDPQGVTLGGKFTGTHVPFGTTFSTGHWLIQRGEELEPYLWRQQDSEPGSIAQYDKNMITHGKIDVISPQWGQGKSVHCTKYTFEGRKAHARFINNITFPGNYLD